MGCSKGQVLYLRWWWDCFLHDSTCVKSQHCTVSVGIVIFIVLRTFSRPLRQYYKLYLIKVCFELLKWLRFLFELCFKEWCIYEFQFTVCVKYLICITWIKIKSKGITQMTFHHLSFCFCFMLQSPNLEIG